MKKGREPKQNLTFIVSISRHPHSRVCVNPYLPQFPSSLLPFPAQKVLYPNIENESKKNYAPNPSCKERKGQWFFFSPFYIKQKKEEEIVALFLSFIPTAFVKKK